MRRRAMNVVAVLACTALTAGCGAQETTTSAAAGASQRVGIAGSRTIRVHAGAMDPTIPVGSKIFVNQGTAGVGTVILTRVPEGALSEMCGPKPHVVRPGGAACNAPVPKESKFEVLERIVAGPGDEIFLRQGHVYRRAAGSTGFIRESDPYIRECGDRPECDFPVPIRIPTGHWFMMGDNRGESTDSRFWGPVPTAWITGVVTRYESPQELLKHQE